MKQKVSFDPDFPFQDVPLTEDNIQQQQSLLTWPRSYHIGDESGISLFDVLAAASITGFVYQRMEWELGSGCFPESTNGDCST